jgi:hypothetical protein
MMAYGRNTFINPASGAAYEWPVNHSEEAQFGKTRTITTGGNTGHTGLALQQGDDAPMVIELTGTIFHQAQFDAFVEWFGLCTHQSVQFVDFAGDGYEVILTEFQPLRRRTLRNPRDPSIPLHYWTYTMRMHVLGFVSGPWVGVAP